MEHRDNGQPDDLSDLRELDPAAGVVAPEALRARIAKITDAVEASTTDDAEETTTDVAVDTSAPAPLPLRARRRWLAPVAAAAAVAACLGGGYAWGSGAFATPSAPFAAAGDPVPVATGSADDPAPAISLGAARESGPQAGGSGDAAATTGVTARSVAPWHYANNRRFTIPTFSDAPGSATVYAVDGRAQYSADDATRMAAILGVEGEAFQDTAGGQPYGWTVGDPTSGRPSFRLFPDSGGDVWYSSGILDPWSACNAQISPRYDLDSAPEATHQAFFADVDQCVAATPMPTEQQARDAMSLFLRATGVDEATTQVTVEPGIKQERTLEMSVARVVEGNVTQVVSSVTVSAAGFLSAWGASGTIVSLGTYDIVSPAEAAARLNDPVFAPAYASSTASSVDYESLYTTPTEPPAVPAAGARVPWGITEFEIESARLGLALMTGPAGVQFLAPAYEFTDTDGNVWSVLALAEKDIDPTGGGAQGGLWGRTY